MRKSLICLFIVGLLVVTSGWSTTVTVNKAGTGGAYTSINAALAAGGTHITITDSSTYEEDLIIGNNSTIAGGPPITITSDKTGDQRPRITPTSGCPAYDEANTTSRIHCVQVFAPNSHISNLIIESNAEYSAGCMAIIAEGVVVENCLFHPRAGTAGILGFNYPLLYCGTQGSGGGVIEPGGRQCDNVIIRNCEFNTVYPGLNPEPVNEAYMGYLSNSNCGASQMVRMDIYSYDGVSGRIIDITFENCLMHYSPDLHIFPSNRGDAGGQLIVYLKNCRMDAAAKFSIRGRGACVVADHTVFTRTNQGNHGDGENSAIAIQTQNSHIDNFGKATDCVFVNCGSAFGKKAYYGGVHNFNSEGTIEVDHCTFDLCLSGVTVGAGGGGTENCKVEVTNSIFHRIGYSSEPGLDAAGRPLAATTPYDIPADKLYRTWYWGLNAEVPYFDAIWSAVFNAFHPSTQGIITVQDTLVGTVADEDTRTWEQVYEADNSLAIKENVLGCRLDCGYVGADQRIRYLNAVTRGTPIFKNTDPDAEFPYELDPSSPGYTPELSTRWGARFGSSVVSSVTDWSLYR